MCGICGVVQRDPTPVDQVLLKRMNDAIVHRGPDSDGYYIGSRVGLGIRRLAIIDLVTGDQPISNEDKSLWVVFNGEIYNHPELRKRLQKNGHHFHTDSDTECLVHLYEEYGDECVHHLRGMFAFALWDEKNQRLLIARDRMGQKPLYFSEQDGALYFSSELPSLLRALPSTPSICYPGIDLYLSLQYIPDPLTPFENVFKLPAANRLIWEREHDSGRFTYRTEQYWNLEYLPKWTASDDELNEQLRELLTEAVQMRLISDVPLGAHLSGGIDSSIIVALMAQASTQPVKTFSVGFQENSFSELPYSRAVAERYRTDHHEFKTTFDDIPTLLESLVEYLGEPLADPSALPLYQLSRLTREHVTVALNGDGGDEAFAGYQRYWLDPWANRYLRLPNVLTNRLIPYLVDYLPDSVNRPIGGSMLNGLKRLGQLPQVSSQASIYRWGSYFLPSLKAQLWNEPFRSQLNLNEAEALLVKQFETAPADSFLDRTLYTDLSTYLPGDLLVKADRMTMAHSLEGRSPFLDHELAAWAARLPEDKKVHGMVGKHLLREAFKDYLPEDVQRRGKQGFGIPIGAWFRTSLSTWMKEILLDSRSPLQTWFDSSVTERLISEHQNGKVDHGKRLWALVVLGLWAEKTSITP